MAVIDPPREPAGLFGNLVLVALVLLLAFQAAYWTWVFVAPPVTASAPAARPEVDLAAIARLFGASPPGTSSGPTAAGLRLKGVVAPTPGVAASAIFSTGSGRDIPVFVGREIQPGATLAEVHPDHVMVSRAGARERIDLEVARSSGGRAPLATRDRGFRVNVARAGNQFSLSRKELDEALRDPAQLNHLGLLGNAPGGGVRMDQAPAGSLAQKLGLQPGDVIRKVNGQAIASQGDLARLYTQFNTISQLQAEVQRGGTTVQLSYSLQP